MELKVEKEVMYNGEKWNVIRVWYRENEAVRVVLGRLKFREEDDYTSYGLEHKEVTPGDIAECAHELTAAEFVEKLKAVFGRAATVSEYDKDQDCCYGMKCDDCPFGDAKLRGIDFYGNCGALVWYHPGKAVKLIDEWLAEREKKKTGKTYLDDFREKFPNSAVNAGGRPGFCRKRLYGSGDLSGCEPGIRCEECWNTVMPEVEGNAEG